MRTSDFCTRITRDFPYLGTEMNYEIASSRVKEDVEKRRKIQLKLGSEAAKVAYQMVKMFGPKEPLLPGGELPNTPKQKVRARRAWLERQYGTSSESRLPGQIWSDYEAGVRPMRWELIRQLAREISDMVGDFVDGSRAEKVASKLMLAVSQPEADLCLLDYENAVDMAELERVLSRMLHRYCSSKLITDRLRFERVFQEIARPIIDRLDGDNADDGDTVYLPPATTGLRTLPYEHHRAERKAKAKKEREKQGRDEQWVMAVLDGEASCCDRPMP